MVTRHVLSILVFAFFRATGTNSLQWGNKASSECRALDTPTTVVEDWEASGTRDDAAAAAATAASTIRVAATSIRAAAITIRAGGLEGRDRRNREAYPEETTWIQEFCRTPGNEFFAEVRMILVSFIRRSFPCTFGLWASTAVACTYVCIYEYDVPALTLRPRSAGYTLPTSYVAV